MVARYTILGSKGYIASHLTKHLRTLANTEILTDSEILPNECLGHVIYCIGVTTDFKSRLADTIIAHVCKAQDVLSKCSFQSFTYLSSTRVYERGLSGSEQSTIGCDPTNLDDFYKISKIAGEACCLADPRENIRVVRLSNVLGMEVPPLTFVPSIIHDAAVSSSIVLNTSLDSAKDYILISDVVEMLVKIALTGKSQIYNLASGEKLTHRQIATKVGTYFKCAVDVNHGAPILEFPDVDITRLKSEFGFRPKSILEALDLLCQNYENLISSDYGKR